MKQCRKCNEWKFDKEFNKRKVCKTCYNHDCNIKQQNNTLRKINIIKNREINKTFIINYLLKNPCKCGEKDIRCLEFHHISEKKCCISQMQNNCLKTLQKEISKCIVLCSNCHKKETSKLFNYYKQTLIKEIL